MYKCTYALLLKSLNAIRTYDHQRKDSKTGNGPE